MAPCKEKPTSSKSGKSIIRLSAAEYLAFVAAGGQSETREEMRYEDENIWLTRGQRLRNTDSFKPKAAGTFGGSWNTAA